MWPDSVQKLVASGRFLAFCGPGLCLPLQGAPSPYSLPVGGHVCRGQQHRGHLCGALAYLLLVTRLMLGHWQTLPGC